MSSREKNFELSLGIQSDYTGRLGNTFPLGIWRAKDVLLSLYNWNEKCFYIINKNKQVFCNVEYEQAACVSDFCISVADMHRIPIYTYLKNVTITEFGTTTLALKLENLLCVLSATGTNDQSRRQIVASHLGLVAVH